MISHASCGFFILAYLIGNASSSYLSISNLARSCAEGPCSVVQSTYFTDSNCSASNAVDNDLADSVCTCPGGRWCPDLDPWIQIDLKVSQLVFAGRIWDQQSSAAEVRQASTLDGFKIWVGDSLPYNAGGNIQCYTAATQQHLTYPYMHSFLCGSSGRYVFFQPTAAISPSTNPSANFSEIQLYPSMPNVARACSGGPCPVTQSTYYTGSFLCDPSHANDGDPSSFVCTCIGGGFCPDADPWLRIDLQQRTPIFAGIITDRAWNAPSRIDNFRIWVGDGTTYNSSGNVRCYVATTTPHLPAPYKHPFECRATGRYVFFQPMAIMAGDAIPNVNFAEMEIFGAVPPVPLPCPAGYTKNASGGPSCELCPAGTFSTGIGELCTGCSAGKYANGEGSGFCENCSSGTFSSSSGTSSCIGCDAGTYSTFAGGISQVGCVACLAGTYSNSTGTSACIQCSAGTFSRPGVASNSACSMCASGTYFSSSGASSCLLCTAGTYFTSEGAVNSSQCTLCDSGTFATASGSTSVSGCRLCLAGTYTTFAGAANCSLCSPGTFWASLGATSSACAACPAGTYSEKSGSTSFGNCQICPAGKYSNSTGASSSGNCSSCASGTYQTGMRVEAMNVSSQLIVSYWLHLCNLCETGTFQSASGSVNCTKCFAGTFQTGSGMITVSNCTQCSFGTYQTGLGSVNASACLFCSAGKYQTGSGLTNINNCTLCRAGTYQTGVGMINCSLCHVGTYQTGQGIIDARNCSLCSAGTYQTGLGISNSSKCSLCAAGKFQTGFGMPSGNNCSQCPLGSYQTGFGGMNCTLCPAGTYQTGMGMLNVINCTLCPAGTYLTTTGMLDVRNCSLCSPGTFQTGFGSISRTNCSQCIAGTYQTGMGSQNCTLCVSGKYQSGFGNINCSLCYLGTYQTGLGFANCSVCGAGSYQSSVGNLNCTQCGQGTYHTGSGLIALSGCLFCDIGTYQTGSGMTDRANCSFCLAGKYQTGVGMPAANNCSLCEIGKYQTGFGTIDCLMCIPGTYQTGLGMPDLKNCSMCLAGSFQTGLGMSNESNCSLCSAGKYQTGTGITFAILCRLCDPGFYATGMGSINCTFCAAGRYQTGFGMMDAANCSLCKEGLFQTGSGMLNRDSCLPCSPGTYHTGLGMSSPSNCSLCGAGLIQSGIGSVNCSSCGPGTYQTGLGMVSYANCSLCEKGKYQTGTGISNATGCMLCVAGKYQTGIGITDSALCSNCGPGYFQTGTGMPSKQNCSLCTVGRFQTGEGMYNSSSCIFCGPGTFQTGEGAVNCTHCSAGTFQSGFGIYNESHCSLCKPGTFQTGTGMLNTSDCLLCSSGKYQTGFGLADPKYCSYCKAGSYQTGSGMVSQDSCALCGAGMYQTGNGMSSSINCSLCLAGTYQSGVGNVNCTLCNTGKYQTGSGMMTDLNCTLCYAGKYQTGTGMMNEDSCDLCTAGTYQSGNGMGNESSCKACDAGKYFSGLGNPSAVNCTTGLSPTLKLQAQATTVVVSTVVAMVVSTSVGSAIGASVGGSVASSGGSGGASIFQLIQATQFMNVFGKLIDQKAAKANNARRSEQLSNISESGADENQESAAFEADDAGDASEFSDQFAWANGRFDDIFSLHPDTCAGVLLQPFFGIVGTAVTVIGASFILRALVNLIMTYASSKSEDDETSSSGLGFGVFEYAVVKTAHLGLCQASGYAISTAMYSPTCGSSAQLVWALALCWLLSFPVGFTLYLGYKMTKSKSNKGIKFARKKHAGSWSAYFKKIFRAEGSHDRFCRPHVIHYSLKIFFGFSGALLLFLAISFVSDPNNDIVRTILLFVFGFISLIIAATLSYKPGRNVVVFLTNILAHHVGKRFTIVEGNAVVEQNRDYTETHSIVLKVYRILLAFFVSCMAWIQAKIEVILDPSMLWALRHRGKWVKKDELKVFYSELNDRAIYFAVFLMIKNVIIGITLADNLVDSLRKAWVIAILYCFELLIHLFYSPDVDAINGLKMAAQVGLQTVIMITAALVTSGRVKSRYGEQICIQVSLVQIFLAIPEQIWSVVSMAILRKNGPPREPDFKTTEEEIAVAREKASLTFGQRLQACAVVLKGIKSMTPALKDGDPAGIITELIIRKNMLLSLEKLNGSVLSIIFDDIFHCRSVRQALEVEMKDRPEISPSVIEILGNKWDTSVDFRDGVSHIYKIKDILEGTENLDVSKSPDPQQHGKAAVVNGLHFGLQTDQGEDLCTINERTQADQFQNLQGTPRHWPGYDTSGLNPFESQPDYTKTFQHHDYTTMSPSSNGFYVSEPQQSLFAFSAVSSPELVFYQPIPEDFTLMQFWHSSVSAQVAETDQLSLDEKKYILDHPKRLGGNSFGLMKGVSGSCSEAAKKSNLSEMANETGWPLDVTKTTVTSNELRSSESTAQGSGAASHVALEAAEINTGVSEDKSAVDNGLFKSFIARVIGASDADTMDGLNEKLTSMLPDQLTGLIEEVPAGLAAANSIMALEMEEDEEEECEPEGTGADKWNDHGNGGLEKGASTARKEQEREATSARKKKKLPFKKAVPAVRLICGLRWDWILFYGSIILALSALFVLTALASTTCTCPPNNTVDDMNSTKSAISL